MIRMFHVSLGSRRIDRRDWRVALEYELNRFEETLGYDVVTVLPDHSVMNMPPGGDYWIVARTKETV